ncbi:N-acetylmuramoyl-L-alanine amidase [Micromonospora sp. NPDC049679]|uniref:peptidoglycan recognition protein family protein n=1 Tax=Micromonospora sp. NPDC049679 TaxID=3155920 RepID=UPI0034111592
MRVPGVRFVQGRNRYGTSTKYAIAVHATANNASAANEAAYATRRTDGTSSHFYADNVEVIQSLDTADRAGHAGSTQGNTYAIAVEFTGLTSWSRAKWLSSVAWERIGAVLAAVSRHHNIPATRATVAQMRSNPRVRGAYDHNQMRLAWGGTDHTDPGPNFPWDKLLAVWQRHLAPPPPPPPPPEEEVEMFLIKKKSDGTVFVSDGVRRRPLPNFDAQRALQAIGVKSVPDVDTDAQLEAVAGPLAA